MNPLGIHALVWAGDLSPASTRHVIEQTRQAGYDLVELSLHGAEIGGFSRSLHELFLAIGRARR